MSTQVVIYSRVNCHLCQEAEKNAREVMVEIPFELQVIYIDGDQELERLYGEEVPVTFINGSKHDYFKVDKNRLVATIYSQITSE
jgi:glutaredoxin